MPVDGICCDDGNRILQATIIETMGCYYAAASGEMILSSVFYYRLGTVDYLEIQL